MKSGFYYFLNFIIIIILLFVNTVNQVFLGFQCINKVIIIIIIGKKRWRMSSLKNIILIFFIVIGRRLDSEGCITGLAG